MKIDGLFAAYVKNAKSVSDIRDGIMMMASQFTINDVDSKGNTILHAIAKNKKKFSFQSLEYDTSIRHVMEDYNFGLKDKAGNTTLHAAISANTTGLDSKLSWFIKIMKLGGRHYQHPEWINLRNKLGETPLSLAVRCTKSPRDIVDALETLSPNPNISDKKGRSPLHYAVSRDNSELVGYLVEVLKADVNIEDDLGMTPYELAVSRNNLEIQTYFLKNPNLKTKTYVPLAPEVVEEKLLWQDYQYFVEVTGGDTVYLNIPFKNGRTVYHILIESIKRQGTDRLVKFLHFFKDREELDINAQDSKGRTPAHYVSLEDIDVRDATFRALADYKAKFDIPDKNGELPLHLLLRAPGHYHDTDSAIYFLISTKEGLDHVSKFGQTPLDLAYLTKDDNVVDYMTMLGCKTSPDFTLSPDKIFSEISRGNTYGIERYLKLGKFINATNNKGDTLYHALMDKGLLDMMMVRLLLKYKVDINKPNGKGLTPLSYAFTHESTYEAANWLVYDDYDGTNFCDPGVTDRLGRNSFHYAALIKNQDVDDYQGAIGSLAEVPSVDQNYNKPDMAKNTPLHYAARYDNAMFINYIGTRHRSDLKLNEINAEGYTPLHIAILSLSTKAARTIIRLGADTDLLDRKGRTALDIVIEFPNQDQNKEALEDIRYELEKVGASRSFESYYISYNGRRL